MGNEREIILTDNGHYWVKFKKGHNVKNAVLAKYEKKTDSFMFMGTIITMKASVLDIVSDIVLLKTDIVPY